MLFHHFEKVEGADEIVLVVSQGFVDGLGSRFFGCEVEHSGDGSISFEFFLIDGV